MPCTLIARPTLHVAIFVMIAMAAGLTTPTAAAQQPDAAAPQAPGAAPPDLPPEPSREAARRIEFSAANIALAFNLLDRNKDGRIGRDEASGIRGVERNFERADVNRDNNLSRAEFEQAMKRSKPR